VSDDLAMHALRGSPAELARQALAAGCDVALHCTGDPADTEALLKDCPTLTPLAIERLGRVRSLAAQRRSTLDTEALAAERTRLLA
jgi:beta-N-acetylhexosaminidase